MKILFTKNIDQATISKELGEDISVDCVEVIKTKPILISPFDLKNYSLIFTSVNGVAAFSKTDLSLMKISRLKTTTKSTAWVKKRRKH